jgi:phenylpropionate dioxygenase-like ring-hydroxylating dioxygenase large terminal subunit
MLSAEDNQRLTRTGPGTPLGEVMRRYWVPALLSSELPGPDCDPVRVKLLGEQLVAIRDSNGRVGLFDQRCPHRGASLYFGRNEEAGLRCVFHGWKFDVDGGCVDVPNEQEEAATRMKCRVKAKTYPVQEAGGVVWTYMGPAEKKPPLHMQEWMTVPAGCSYVTKNEADANWLQMLEGGFDSSHSSFLHRSFKSTGLQTIEYRNKATAPKNEVEPTPYGYSYASLRHLPDKRANYVRVMQFVMPFHQMRPFEGTKGCPLVTGHIWVPIDDEHCWVYSWLYARDLRPLTADFIKEEEAMSGRSPDDFIPGTYRLKRNRDNDYLLDREAQRTRNFTGIEGITAQDQAVQESMGPISDRTIEHLGPADVALMRTRRLLLQACKDLETGKDPQASQESVIALRAAEKLLPEDAKWMDAMANEMKLQDVTPREPVEATAGR